MSGLMPSFFISKNFVCENGKWTALEGATKEELAEFNRYIKRIKFGFPTTEEINTVVDELTEKYKIRANDIDNAFQESR